MLAPHEMPALTAQHKTMFLRSPIEGDPHHNPGYPAAGETSGTLPLPESNESLQSLGFDVAETTDSVPALESFNDGLGEVVIGFDGTSAPVVLELPESAVPGIKPPGGGLQASQGGGTAALPPGFSGERVILTDQIPDDAPLDPVNDWNPSELQSLAAPGGGI